MMPYILKKQREKYRIGGKAHIPTPGELTYLLVHLVRIYMKDKPDSYQIFNEVVGCLECCKQEFYRRIMAPYEDQKLKDNGDVFEEGVQYEA